MKHLSPIVLLGLFLGLRASAAEVTNQPSLRPFFSGTIRAGAPAGNLTPKGVVIPVSEQPSAFVCYDTDLLRMSAGWVGGSLNFGNYMREISHPQPPEVAGQILFGTAPVPGWVIDDQFGDTRQNHQGPLPKTIARYKGIFVSDNAVVLSYSVAGCDVFDSPAFVAMDDWQVFTRNFSIGKSAQSLSVLLLELPATNLTELSPANRPLALRGEKNTLIVAAPAVPDSWQWQSKDGRLYLKIPPLATGVNFNAGISSLPAAQSIPMEIEKRLRSITPATGKAIDLPRLGPPKTPNWPNAVVTKGIVSANTGPYVVDTLTEPVPNPWNAKTFFGGFDFFPDGRAAICTFHGDVWLVSGIDEQLASLTWKRHATGLFQPLGLRIVDGVIYVTGRDQITRLHDLNNDGEADFYENFNNDTVATGNYHEFCMDLHTDSAGDFYYAKASPWPPDVTTPHQGTILKVAKDGSKLDVFATGLRAPNGMSIGPRDEMTVSDNQGHWMPANKLNFVKAGGFYGMMPAAHRTPKPIGFDPPIAWVPMNADNSSGGQVWSTSAKWGPLKDRLLFMSYGKCTLWEVMPEEVDGTMQAAMVSFPFRFNSGIMRGRVNPVDGQVYLCGLRGWQTSGLKDGGFYRVRYTGQPVYMPNEFHARTEGIDIAFTAPLEPTTATDPGNWSIEEWNYLWSREYGSPDFSVKDAAVKGHDSLVVKAVKLSADGRRVSLEIPELKPAMQTKLKYNIRAADGAAIAQEIYGTIHHLGASTNSTVN